jgi:hypothetical protein
LFIKLIELIERIECVEHTGQSGRLAQVEQSEWLAPFLRRPGVGLCLELAAGSAGLLRSAWMQPVPHGG